jgi:hypothetical protein
MFMGSHEIVNPKTYSNIPLYDSIWFTFFSNNIANIFYGYIYKQINLELMDFA